MTGMRKQFGWAPFFLFLLALGLRLLLLDQKNLWYDEVYSWQITRGSFQAVIDSTSLDIHPPLYYFLLKIWSGFFSDSIFSLRFLSALLSALAFFPVYGIAREILPRRESLFAAALYAISPLSLCFAQEARMYPLNELLNAASVFLFLKAFRAEQPRFCAAFAAGFSITTALALYTHYYSALLFGAQAVFLVLRAGRLDRRIKVIFFASFTATFLLFLPWIPVVGEQLSTGQPWRPHPGFLQALHQPFLLINDFAAGRYALISAAKYLPLFEFLSFLALVPCLVLVIHRSWKSFSDRDPRKEGMALLGILVLLPFAFSCGLGFFRVLDLSRYLVILLPFMLVLLVSSLALLNRSFAQSVLAVFFLLNIAGLVLYFGTDHKLHDYRGILTTLESGNRAGDPLYVYPHYYGSIVDYYRSRALYRGASRVNYGWTIEMLEDRIRKDRPEAFWLILDENSVDTERYGDYLARLPGDYRVSERLAFSVWPGPARLYRIQRSQASVSSFGSDHILRVDLAEE